MLADKIAQAQHAFETAVRLGYKHFILMYSGGKDSATTTILALEWLRANKGAVERVDVMYVDTRMELPPVRAYAARFLSALREMPRLADLPLAVHHVHTPAADSFWAYIIGRGYRPPRVHSRWCTNTIKVKPYRAALARLIQDPARTIVVTGVRRDESPTRQRTDDAYYGIGESDVGVRPAIKVAPRKSSMAPCYYWTLEDVWTFLEEVAPGWGYPTADIRREVYIEPQIRFGCWACTVVEKDKALEAFVKREQWAHLVFLRDFRELLLRLPLEPWAREERPDGRPGSLTLAARAILLAELYRVQNLTGVELATAEELGVIRDLWREKGKTEAVRVGRRARALWAKQRVPELPTEAVRPCHRCFV